MKSKLLLLNLITLILIFPFSLRADNTPPLNFQMKPQENGYTIIEQRNDGTTKEIGHLVLNDTGYHVSGNEIGTIYTSVDYSGENKTIEMYDNSDSYPYWGQIVYNDDSFLKRSYSIHSYTWRVWEECFMNPYTDMLWNRKANVKPNFWQTEFTISTRRLGNDTEMIEIARLKRPFFFGDTEWSVEILDKNYFINWQFKEKFPNDETHSKKDVFCPHSLAIMAAILKHNPDFWKNEKSFSKMNSALKQFSAQKIPLLKVQSTTHDWAKLLS